jgi:hypothetical protein
LQTVSILSALRSPRRDSGKSEACFVFRCRPERLEPLWRLHAPDGLALLEVAVSSQGYAARRAGGPWQGGFGVSVLTRDAVHDVAALLAATDAGNRSRPGRTP